MKKIFKSIWNFILGKKDTSEYIYFYETFSSDYIKQVLRHIIYNLKSNPDKEIPELRLNNNYVWSKSYFAGATLCSDIKVDDKIFGVITITSEGSVGWFDPIFAGKQIIRENLLPIEMDIYKDIYEIVKGKKLEKNNIKK